MKAQSSNLKLQSTKELTVWGPACRDRQATPNTEPRTPNVELRTSYYGFLPDGNLWVCDDGLQPELYARLRRLQPEVQAALARQDYAGALSLAYGTLQALAHALRPAWADTLPPDQALIQALLVEVERRPLVALEDMTLQELQGTAVWVSHRAWATTREEALAIARRLTTSLRDLTGFSKPVRSRPWQVVTWSDGRVVA